MEMEKQVHFLKEKINEGETLLDEDFDALFSEKIRLQADRHFTSCYVSKVAAQFLSENNSPYILDIGSGTGKFCLIGALYEKAIFTGIEYRAELVDIALELKREFQLDNVEFIHENIINHSFQPYNGFFMFNPFLEHRNAAARMDHFQDAPEKEMEYSYYVKDQLSQCQPSARLATFYVLKNQIPSNFKVVKESMGGMLLFWVSE
jgi:SAM-dependent methyltransferase